MFGKLNLENTGTASSTPNTTNQFDQNTELKNVDIINGRDLKTDIDILKAFDPDHEPITEEDNDSIDAVNKKFDIHENPKIIQEIIEERGGNAILHSNQTPVEFLEEFEDTFGEDNPESVEAVRRVLIEDELLPPSAMPEEVSPTDGQAIEKELDEAGPTWKEDIPIIDRDKGR